MIESLILTTLKVLVLVCKLIVTITIETQKKIEADNNQFKYVLVLAKS